jgi:hypothetical protein
VRGHLDPQTLAGWREGLLSRRKAARVRAHLSACQRCTRADADIAGVTAVLAQAPVPPMPPALAARIEAALAAEAAARKAAAGPVAAASAAPVPGGGQGPATAGTGPPGAANGGTARDTTPRPGARKDRWSPLALRIGAAAAVVAVIAGGALALTHTGQILSGSSATSAGSHATGGQGNPKVAAPVPDRQREAGPLSVAAPLISSGTNYLPAQLPGQVARVLAQYAPNPPGLNSPAHSAPAPAFGEFRYLPACVRRVTGGRRPALVDLARYRGRPAAVIVVRGGGPGMTQVWVVGEGCSATVSDVLAHTSLTSPR